MHEIPNLPALCETLTRFWRPLLPPPDRERTIFVEAMVKDPRVAMRNLTLANALRRIEPARLVVYTGADEEWNDAVWGDFDTAGMTALARAYGADEVVDIHDLVDRRTAGDRSDPTPVGGPLPPSGIDPDVLELTVDATVCRLAKVPRLDASPELARRRRRTRRRAEEFARVYEALLGGPGVVALVSSHVDYDSFGLAVEAAVRHDVPVLFTQSTGGLKAYAIFPESGSVADTRDAGTVRARITRNIGEYVERHVWRQHELLRPEIERVAWRVKGNLGSPAWWRGRKLSSHIGLRDAAERAAVRRLACRRLGLDPDLPTVTVFNHGVSDALGTNHEAFADLGAWFEETAAYAAGRPEVNWLFLDHPLQSIYDGSGFFESVAACHRGVERMRFAPSQEFSKSALVALTDLVLTVRGSVGHEYPAFGIPAIQAGWSEWSDCGFTTVASTTADYFDRLEEHLVGLLAGRPLMTREQIERARMWAWFYRSLTDVATPLVPHWSLGVGRDLVGPLTLNLRHVESDADPAFGAVRRMWQRREPFLTRFDLTGSAAQTADLLALREGPR